ESFPVKVSEDTKVSRLRKSVRDGKQRFANIDEEDLILWKVNIPTYGKDLGTVILADNIKEQLGGVELSPFENVGLYFVELEHFSDQEPISKYIRIIVQPPTTTDQWHTNVSRNIANLHYQPRQQNGLGGTLIPRLTNDETFEGISLTDPDISHRFEKTSSLIKDLIKKKVLLIRAPPYSGKTSMAQLMEYHLVSSSEYSKYRVIRISMLWGSAVGVNCSWETFGELWKRVIGISWIEWVGQCQQIPTILILDEVQLIYKQERGIDESNETSADVFWRTVKGCLQEMSNIYIIMFGTYGYHSANSAGLSTP
ncbi:1176_t:CDS:2, partial [Ambispora gerdemannii]